MSIASNILEKTDGDDANAGKGRSVWRHFNIAVVACILALAALLGILNNLRVAVERRVKWFDAPTDHSLPETAEEALP